MICKANLPVVPVRFILYEDGHAVKLHSDTPSSARGEFMQHEKRADVSHRTSHTRRIPRHNSRARYIKYQLGFSHDPFLQNVAEKEVSSQPQHFYLYFLDMDEGLLPDLTQARHCIVFAPAGSGKTTLRLNLAHRLRLEEPAVLPLTYEVVDITGFQTDQMLKHFVREFGKDLLISVLRLYGEMVAPPTIDADGAAGQVLATLAHTPQYRRQLQRLRAMTFDQPLDSIWSALGRPGTPQIAWSSPAVRACVDTILTLPPVTRPVSMSQVADSLRTFGHTHLYVLVDGIDAINRSVDEMLQQLLPLFAWAQAYAPWFILKLFLPAELANVVQQQFASLADDPMQHQANLFWSNTDLERALYQRLRTANSSFDNIDDLFDGRDAARIRQELIRSARGSPRELFRLVSAMIDFHVGRKARSTSLSAKDWQAVKPNITTS